MSKKIIIDLGPTGIEVAYDGFEGKFCYKEADKLAEMLKAVGIEVNDYQSRGKSEKLARVEPTKITA